MASVRLGRHNQRFDRLLPLHRFEGLPALFDRETVSGGLGHRKIGVMRLGNPDGLVVVLRLGSGRANDAEVAVIDIPRVNGNLSMS